MPIKYNVIERGEPGVTGGGTKMVCHCKSSDGEVSIDDIVKAD